MYITFIYITEFRNKVQRDYPEVYDTLKKVANQYLSVLPETWRNRITSSVETQSATDKPK